jgi:hypothetical protein
MNWKRWFPLGWKRECGFLLGALLLFSPLPAFLLFAPDWAFEPEALVRFSYAGGVQFVLMLLLFVRYCIELHAARVSGGGHAR